jgi:ribosomal protein S18 acetylase RimI-like enzyme
MTRPIETTDVVIRDYEAGDYERILEIWEEGGLPLKPRGRDSRANIAKQVRLAHVCFLVALADGRLIGTVLATHDGRKGWINRLAVEPSSRRRRVGRRLVLEAEKWLAAQGLEIFACLIEEENEASQEAFESLGYKKHPEIQYFTKRLRPDV